METPSPRRLGAGSEGVTRKPSFKCGGPGRGQGPRVSRRSTTTTVQALTTKFDLLSSQMPQGKRSAARMVVGRPKKLAKPALTSPTNAPKPKIMLEPPKDAVKVSEVVEATEIVSDASQETPSRDSAVLEPIYEKPCLPVRTAIGIFEKAGTPKPAKPVAAIKPILKIIDVKPKAKLAPKDSLCRVRYNVMRRTRESTGEDHSDSDDEHLDKPASKHAVVDHNRLDKLFVKQETADDCSMEVKQKPVSVKVSETVSKHCDDYVPKLNQSSLYRESVASSTVLLRKTLEVKVLEALNQKLASDNISLTSNNCLKPEMKFNSSEMPRMKLTISDVFNQISQSTAIPAKYIAKKEEQVRKETSPEKEIVIKNTQNQGSAFSRISQSEVVTAKSVGGKERRFATLLNKQVKELDLKLTPSTPSASSAPIILDVSDKANAHNNSPKCLTASVRADKAVTAQEEPTKAENLKPNSSFLWSKSWPDTEERSKVPQPDKPLPKPPETFLPDCFYDTIGDRTSLKSDEGTEYDDISVGDRNDTYDDIGVASLNHRNISESLYCISDKLDSLNIYEDIQSLRASIENYERVEGKDSIEEEKPYSDACYESIYGGNLGHSDDSEKSSFEKNNSLYESAHDAQQQLQVERHNSLYESAHEMENNHNRYEAYRELLPATATAGCPGNFSYSGDPDLSLSIPTALMYLHSRKGARPHFIVNGLKRLGMPVESWWS